MQIKKIGDFLIIIIFFIPRMIYNGLQSSLMETMAEPITIFYLLYAFHLTFFLWKFYIDWRQYQFYRGNQTRSESLFEFMTEEEFQKARNYQLQRMHFHLLSSVFTEIKNTVRSRVAAIYSNPEIRGFSDRKPELGIFAGFIPGSNSVPEIHPLKMAFLRKILENFSYYFNFYTPKNFEY